MITPGIWTVAKIPRLIHGHPTDSKIKHVCDVFPGVVQMRAFDGDSGDTGVPFNGGAGGGSQRAIELPEGVADTPAGARLAALLESVSVEQVSGFDTVEYVKAAYRLVNHYQGMFLKAVLETGVRLPAPDDQVARAESPGEFAGEEARAALVWSRKRADGALGRAYQMFGQTPAVGDALTTGAIDEPRANALINWTSGLSDEHATRVIDELLPVAPKVTVSELIDRIKRLAIALDPEWAERRYRESLKERRVELRQTPFGTADLAGRDLPVERAKASADRIHGLAISCKKAGDKRHIDLIRADLYLGMLDGLFQHMTDPQIVDHVLTHPVSDARPGDHDPTDDHDDRGDSGGTSDGGGPGTGADGPWRGGDDNLGDDKPGGGTAGKEHAEPGNGSSSGDTPESANRATPTTGEDCAYDQVGDDAGGREASNKAVADSGTGGENAARPPAGSAWNVHELRVELTTLLGLDDHPAELPGLGYVPASVAREHAERMTSGEWRFVICTDEGIPICSGLTSRRPTTFPGAGRDTKRGGILELQLTAGALASLAASVEKSEHSAWAAVINDINGRYNLGVVDNTPASAGRTDGTTEHVDARRRRARAGLRRWIEVRARYCLHPACRMPATHTDQDHRVDYAAGGLTVDQNLDPECRHDHRLQHDGGWIVYRLPDSDPLTGPIVWISPLGHRYTSRPPPVMQPYPEPGDHYPGRDTMPEWFTKLIEQVKSARRAAANEREGDGAGSAESAHVMRRQSRPAPGVPPF